MITNLNQILYDIDLEIDDIDLYGYDIIETSLSMVHRLQNVLNDLRNKLQTYVFPSKEEEISFFKNFLVIVSKFSRITLLLPEFGL